MAVRPTTDGYRVQLDDGSVLDVASETRAKYHLDPDITLDAPTLSVLRAETALRHARSVALGLVARAEHTRLGLERKLRTRGHDPMVVDRVLDTLAENGLLDDERAARLWVEQRMRRGPAGRDALLAGLARNGVSREIAERVVGSAVSREDEDLAARRALERLYRTPESREHLGEPDERARALRRLVGRGHTQRASRRALASVLGRRTEDADTP